MTVGLSAANAANKMLDALTNTSFASGSATLYIKYHVGDPGSAGTANASTWTTRSSATFNAAASGSKTLSNTPTTGAVTVTGTEVWTHISLWTAATGGTFLASAALNAQASMSTGDTFNQSTCTLVLQPTAA